MRRACPVCAARRHVDAVVGTLLPVAYTVWVLVLFLRMDIRWTHNTGEFPIFYWNATSYA